MWTFKALEIARLGLRSLRQHTLRSLLTMLGILCGVAAVIAMLAIGEGTSLETQEQFIQLGASNIILTSVKPAETETQESSSFTVEYGLTYDDAERIQSTLRNVEVVVPQRRVSHNIRYRDRKIRAMVVGTVPWLSGLMGGEVAEGRFLNELDERRRRNYCVLGAAVVKKLFPLKEPMGRFVRVGESYYRVVGIMAERGRGPTRGSEQSRNDYNREVYIPLSTARTRFGETIFTFGSGSRSAEKVELHQVLVHCDAVDQVQPVARAVRTMLDRYHPKQDYAMTVPLRQIRAAQEAGRRFSIMLGCIAAISLLVGGIGIMNIMLANVTERTREIGIRRALGAKKRDITFQFLTETVIISLTGGVLGVLGGVLIPLGIEQFADQRTQVTAWALGVSLVISLAVGVIFGVYPAWRAAQLDPIEALRHE